MKLYLVNDEDRTRGRGVAGQGACSEFLMDSSATKISHSAGTADQQLLRFSTSVYTFNHFQLMVDSSDDRGEQKQQPPVIDREQVRAALLEILNEVGRPWWPGMGRISSSGRIRSNKPHLFTEVYPFTEVYLFTEVKVNLFTEVYHAFVVCYSVTEIRRGVFITHYGYTMHL